MRTRHGTRSTPAGRLVAAAALSVLVAASLFTVIALVVDPSMRVVGPPIAFFSSIATIGGILMAVIVFYIQARGTAENLEQIKENIAFARRDRGLKPEAHPWSDIDQGALLNKFVLWIDDLPENVVHEIKAFRASGATVDYVRNTEAAKEALMSNRYDLVISDMARPEGARAGYEVLKFVNLYFSETPIIIYSGVAGEQHVASAVKAGAFSQVADPWSLYRKATQAVA